MSEVKAVRALLPRFRDRLCAAQSFADGKEGQVVGGEAPGEVEHIRVVVAEVEDLLVVAGIGEHFRQSGLAVERRAHFLFHGIEESGRQAACFFDGEVQGNVGGCEALALRLVELKGVMNGRHWRFMS